ncbi:hypothetical protein [Crocosphaera chwakensis]|uniref:Uncharacterized protein n=1 Tax=Crocosphaera chwakensis CCY0110 TaxID=391612 RepID=A3IZH0_9CHRO|nr:hypothetical protein [Crocosphaera chwakensis]EAZ88133.1 hypothetical protein CY0110_10912 [Crocosphaera chwakensis CCY0110]
MTIINKIKLNKKGVLVILIGFHCLTFITTLIWVNHPSFPRRVLGDVELYYDYSLNILNGALPYKDFPVEYPPLSLLTMLLPQLINFCKFFFGFVPNLRDYTKLFCLENTILSLIIAVTILKIELTYEKKTLYK